VLFLSHDPHNFAVNISGAAIGHLVLVGIVILIYFHCDRLVYVWCQYTVYMDFRALLSPRIICLPLLGHMAYKRGVSAEEDMLVPCFF